MSKQLQEAIAKQHMRERESTRKLLVYIDMLIRTGRIKPTNKNNDDNSSVQS
jgi:hypothetical protein